MKRHFPPQKLLGSWLATAWSSRNRRTGPMQRRKVSYYIYIYIYIYIYMYYIYMYIYIYIYTYCVVFSAVLWNCKHRSHPIDKVRYTNKNKQYVVNINRCVLAFWSISTQYQLSRNKISGCANCIIGRISTSRDQWVDDHFWNAHCSVVWRHLSNKP